MGELGILRLRLSLAPTARGDRGINRGVGFEERMMGPFSSNFSTHSIMVSDRFTNSFRQQKSFQRKVLFSYVSSSTLYPCESVDKSQFRTSLASRLASLLPGKSQKTFSFDHRPKKKNIFSSEIKLFAGTVSNLESKSQESQAYIFFPYLHTLLDHHPNKHILK